MWETVDKQDTQAKHGFGKVVTQRMDVPGGWLVRTGVVKGDWPNETTSNLAICFVPDPEGKWPLEPQ